MIDKETGMPTHAFPHMFYLCMDSRKGDCPYYCKVVIDTEAVGFDQGFCGYSFRKKNVGFPNGYEMEVDYGK